MTDITRRFAWPLALVAAFTTALTPAPLFSQAEQEALRTDYRPPNLEPGEEIPWLYEGSNIPVNKAWTFGTLSNGLRYAVRNNRVPPRQVSIRVRIDAGSLMEQDAERGFAHLIEHLTFRGSKYVPDGEAVRVWQRLGASFGSDSNAETTPTQTVYKLDLPDADPADLDEAVRILSGMIREPSLDAAGVTAEVPVVLAELRERAGAQQRIADASGDLFFAGQRLADRSPIGTVETLEAATSPTVRAFHGRWYRPENTVISISGDGDPEAFVALLERYFGDWKVTGVPAKAPDFGDPDPDAAQTRLVVEPSLPNLVTLGIIRPWRPVNDTIAYNQQLFIDILARQLINRRLEARARGGGSFLQANASQDDISRSVDGTFISVVPIGEDWEGAVADVRAVIEDALTQPPSEAEIEREYTEIENLVAIRVENADTESSADQADEIVQAVDIRETIASPEAALELVRGLRPLLTPERLLESTRAQFTGVVERAMLIAPKTPDNGEARLLAALTDPVAADGSARIADNSLTFDDLPEIGPPGTVVQTAPLGILDMEIVTFSNGVRAILYPNDAEEQKISVRVRFGRGYQDFKPDNAGLLWTGQAALVQSGVADFGLEELDRLTTGRRIGLSFAVDNDAFELGADTRPADLRDQLHLLAAKLAYPRWDDAPVARARAGTKLAYDSYDINPQAVIERDLIWLLRDRDPRWKTPTPEDADAATLDAFRKTWESRLGEGPMEVLLFGDFDRDAGIQALAETFGALPARTAAPVDTAAAEIRFPAPTDAPVVLRHEGDADQAAAVIAWPTGGGLDRITVARKLEVLSSIINNRLLDKLRSQEGASYAPFVTNSWPEEFADGGYFGVITQLAPERIGRFYEVVDEIIADLAANPIDQDELTRNVEPLRQIIDRASTGNTFWMMQLEGVTQDPQRLAVLRHLRSDITSTTPEEIQLLTQRYLVDSTAWKLVILPEEAPAAAD